MSEPVSEEASLARSTAGMAAGTIASRVLGVVRASLQLAVVGTLLAAASIVHLAADLAGRVIDT